MNAMGYIRISPRGSNYDGVSLEVQTAAIKAYCAFKGWNLVGVYGDKFLSGKNIKDRPGLNAVLLMAEDKAFDAVVCYKLDRFSRNTIELLDTVTFLEDRGLIFASVSEEINTRSATGKFFLTMLGALGQMEREQVSERTKAALHLKKIRGEVISRCDPYGFRRVGKSKKLVKSDRDWECYKRIKELREGGVPYTAFSDILYSEGYRNRLGEKRSYSSIWRLEKFFDRFDSLEDVWAARLSSTSTTSAAHDN